MTSFAQGGEADHAAPPMSLKGGNVTVKTMFDHGQHPNHVNRMVIPDNDPRVGAVMKAALSRHQESLKAHEDFIKKTHDLQKELTHE